MSQQIKVTDETLNPTSVVDQCLSRLISRLTSYCTSNGLRLRDVAPDIGIDANTVHTFVGRNGRRSTVQTLILIESFLEEFDV